jgi:hypothetical protein
MKPEISDFRFLISDWRPAASSLGGSIALVVWVVLAAGCRPAEDPERVEFRARLAEPARLSDDEVARLVSWTVAAVGNKAVRVRESSGTRTLDDKGRADVLSLLAGSFLVADSGVRNDGDIVMRGISGPGTPLRSELDAAQTLWIDTTSFLPRRYEMAYSLPGMGDVVYEVIVDR